MSMNYLDYLDYLQKTHWIALYVNDNNVTYFDSFEVEHIPKEIKKFIEKKIITNIYRIQVYDSIICRYFRIRFIDFMLKGNSLLEYANLFFPNDYQKNDEIIINYLIEEINWDEIMSKKHKKVCRVLNYIDHTLIVISMITGNVTISTFASLVGIPLGIASSTIGLKFV